MKRFILIPGCIMALLCTSCFPQNSNNPQSNYFEGDGDVPTEYEESLFSSLSSGDSVEARDGSPFETLVKSGQDIVSGENLRKQIIQRAEVWVSQSVPYNQMSYYNGYRTDCSGYVSYAWQLDLSSDSYGGANTTTLPKYADEISVDDLKPGDILNMSLGDKKGHAIIFAEWEDKNSLTFWGYEQNGFWGKAKKNLLTLEKKEDNWFIPEEKGGEGPYIPFRWKVLSQLSEGTVLGISDDPSNKTSQSNSIPQEIMLREIDNMEMVFVEQGSFTMGTEDGAYRSPLHEVYLESYWIDKYEVTNEQFSAFLNIHGNQKVDGKDWFDIKWQNRSKVTVSGKSGKPTYSPIDGYENHPVVSVSWHGARAYCQWIGGDLPTEEQWEKAARGTDGRTFPWGEHDPSCGEAFHGHCVSEPPDADTKAVGGQHPVIVSPYGAHDMAGNVAEWVLGWDYDDFIMNSEDNVSYTPLNGYIPIARGGSWRDTSKTFFQVFYRYPGGGAEPFIGFR